MNSEVKQHHPEKTIFLSGFMASGKSTLGKVLAQKLECPFLDLDDVIEEREGKEIREIFDKEGEPYFRQKEREYLLELAKDFEGVLSLGGGASQDQGIIEKLKAEGILIFLDTPMEQIVERVLNSNERPILFDENGKRKTKEALFAELKALYSDREKFYKQAPLCIDTTAFSSVEEMAEATIDKINRHV
ncbi:shikimate kinase [Gracilimonas mengyeensis]|uniref:Shikimate kinase n=1 Tax=Gracilimonas mengyeensis TaxID=1302730 RepID=A0A521C4P5_9BACT|nr:shikimate kinase [Gracilimonas mengyeensis]SMO54378.1 shikimate kinase [Gracilimonas mengyeensis]